MKLIPLSKGKAFAQVDDEDYEELIKYKWHTKPCKNTTYAVRETSKKTGRHKIYMHLQIIPDRPEGYEVDHKDHNGLNNQRSNLRVCTGHQNTLNKSIPKGTLRGACWCNKNKAYYTAVYFDGVNHWAGYFDKAEDAARYYDALASKYHGEFASLNFPNEPLVDLEKAKPASRKWKCGVALRKLTEEKVKDIRKRIDSGERQKDVAARYKVSRSAILRITNNETWSYVK